MRLNAILLMGLAGTALAMGGCVKHVKAPMEPGVCYFIGHPAGGELKFNVVAKNDPDIEHCAVHLYNLRMDMIKMGTAGQQTEGTYGGSFLFVENTEVYFAQRYEDPPFPLLVKAPDGRLVAPGSIVQEDDTPTGPQTVEIPKNLPTKP